MAQTGLRAPSRRSGLGAMSGSRCASEFAFGPVPSRRLGHSLGVNIVPCKTCAYSCAYCQLGRTTNLSVKRRQYYRTAEVMRGVTEKLRAHWQKTDYVTFLGCGEPTLASNLAEVCSAISDIWKGKKALLTSGALIWKSEVRRDSLGFDVVLPTVSAGEQGLWRKIHRPHPSLSYAKVMSGLRGFAAEFSGQIWVEVMLLRGVNDDLRNLEGIRKAIEPLNPEKIQLMAPTRPPAEKWVHCPSKEAVERAIAAIPGSVDMTEPEKGEFAARRDEAVEDLLAMAMVHPMREEQAMGVLLGADLSSKDASSILKSLEGSGKLIRKVYKGTEFYRAEE